MVSIDKIKKIEKETNSIYNATIKLNKTMLEKIGRNSPTLNINRMSDILDSFSIPKGYEKGNYILPNYLQEIKIFKLAEMSDTSRWVDPSKTEKLEWLENSSTPSYAITDNGETPSVWTKGSYGTNKNTVLVTGGVSLTHSSNFTNCLYGISYNKGTLSRIDRYRSSVSVDLVNVFKEDRFYIQCLTTDKMGNVFVIGKKCFATFDSRKLGKLGVAKIDNNGSSFNLLTFNENYSFLYACSDENIYKLTKSGDVVERIKFNKELFGGDKFGIKVGAIYVDTSSSPYIYANGFIGKLNGAGSTIWINKIKPNGSYSPNNQYILRPTKDGENHSQLIVVDGLDVWVINSENGSVISHKTGVGIPSICVNYDSNGKLRLVYSNDTRTSYKYITAESFPAYKVTG